MKLGRDKKSSEDVDKVLGFSVEIHDRLDQSDGRVRWQDANTGAAGAC